MIEIAYVNTWGDPVKVPSRTWKFPCGEVGFILEPGVIQLEGQDLLIQCNFESNDDLLAMAQAKDALDQIDSDSITLAIAYFPYSRQDRRCSEGEGHALKMVANFINSLKFDKVVTLDAHSTVLEALVDRLVNVPQEVCAEGLPKFDMLVAPDAGAEKKIFKHQQVVEGGVSVITASKKRDSNGKITGVYVQNPWTVADMNVCIVDDLCDGGATFLALAEQLRKHSPSSLNLYVTHGMFTKGMEKLFETFDHIYVKNLRDKSLEAHGQITVL